jgi:hypothetical protein
MLARAGLFSIVAAALALSARGADKPSAPSTKPAVLVELFTSEGCSSCPPADQFLAELSTGNFTREAQIIPIALHVDYWNRSGWTDPFSSEKFTQRQQDYARAFHIDQVYTPQMVVDGAEQIVGGDQKAALAAISRAAAATKAKLALEPTVSADGKSLTCKLSLSDLPAMARGAADVRVVVTEDDLSRDVLRGENAGRKLQHTAVARSLQLIAQLDLDTARDRAYSGGTKVELQAEWHKERLKIVAFVQARQTRRILAVATAPVAAR